MTNIYEPAAQLVEAKAKQLFEVSADFSRAHDLRTANIYARADALMKVAMQIRALPNPQSERPAPPRKVVQIATQSAVKNWHDGYTLALANDGTMWWRGLNDPDWTELPPIPQPGKAP